MKLLKILYSLLFSSIIILAQNGSVEKLRVYVEGDYIDFNYIRNNIDFIDFVNDSKISDVHIIVNHQSTGGGGHHFTINFNQNGMKTPGNFSLSCNTFSFDTEDVIRTKLTSAIKSGLAPYVNEKNGSSVLSITSHKGSNKETGLEPPTYDSWKSWIFKLGLDGGFSGEEQRKSFNYSISLEAVKVTENWKINNEYDYERRENFIDDSDEGEKTIHAAFVEQDADIRTVFSLSEKWSSGLFFEGSQNTYRNNKIAFEFTPAIEYNFFPWNESDKRTFTISYFVGPKYNRYYETTILNKNSEWLFAENMRIRLERIETWGDIESWIEAGHYFPGFNDYYFEAGIDLGLRVAKGLFFKFEIQAESIHNQRYLAANELSEEEILLNTRKLPTTFEYYGRMGIEFQFGSIFNNVVNERL